MTQGTFFGNDEYRTAWPKEEIDRRLDQIRAGMRQKTLDHLRAKQAAQQTGDLFHDRRSEL